MATASNTFADLVALWVDRGFRGMPNFTRKRRADGEFEAFVRAPRSAMAGRLSIMTFQGNLYVRMGPPHTLYPVDSQRELVFVVRHIVRERAMFALTYKDNAWTGTTLVNRGTHPIVRRGEVAYVLSWSGRFDERIESAAHRRPSTRMTPADKALQPTKRAPVTSKSTRRARVQRLNAATSGRRGHRTLRSGAGCLDQRL